jgi:hypothetical protein
MSVSPVRRIRASLGLASAALAVAAVLWLIPASVQIVDWPRTGPQRIAVFAPLYHVWWTGLVTLIASMLVLLAARRRGIGITDLAFVLAPLHVLWLWTVPYWPWLGDRLPLLLVLAGPLRWLIAVLAVAGAGVRAATAWSRGGRAIGWPSPPQSRTLVFVVTLAIYLFFGLRSLSTIGLGGDEPHYLVITHSLLVDHDLQIENNHTRGDYRAFFGGELRPDYLQRGVNGQIYSIHAPGLSVLLLPAYAVAGARGAIVTVCVLAAVAALAVFEIAAIVAGLATAWLTWAMICFTVPFIPHAWALYPEIAGAAIVAWAIVWTLRSRDRSPTSWLWRGVCLAMLPWLHTKFTVLLAGLIVCLLWNLRARWRSAAALVLPIAISGVAWIAFFWIIYRSIDPQVPYGGYTAQFVRVENIPRSLFGLLFDQKFGFLIYAPIYLLLLPGLRALFRDRQLRQLGVMTVLTAGAYVISAARLYMWWGGSSAPARFLVPVLPLLAPAIALGLTRVKDRAATVTVAIVAAMSLAVAAAGAIGPGDFLLFSSPHGVARILERVQGSAPLAAALPTFTQEEWRAPALQVLPWLAAALLGWLAGWIAARRRVLPFWIATTELVVLAFAAAVANASFPEAVRTESATRGAFAMLETFDPIRRRAYDYETRSKLAEDRWLRRSTMVFEREAGSDPDPQGRTTDSLSLPPGRYELSVWFQGNRARDGALQAAVGIGEGRVLRQLEGPLANPAVLTLDLPVAVPSMWVLLTDAASARAARRLEIRPLSLVPAGDRIAEDVRAVESLPTPPNAYLAYVDEGTYPENGVFWTRGTERGTVVLAPAGATTLVATLHVGPVATAVTIWVDQMRSDIAMAAEETRVLRLPLARAARAVTVAVQAGSSFRPSEVASAMTDSRSLGCQVRVSLE